MKAKRLIIVPAVLAILLLAQAALAQEGVEKIGQGQIDWMGYLVRAEGIGVAPPNAANAAQARAMARRAAVVVARRNLLEVVKGVHIDSVSTVENFVATNDVVLNRVQGVLEGSKVDSVQEQPDGSVKAVVSMALSGQLGETLLSLAPPPGMAPPPGESPALKELERRVENLEKAVAKLERLGADAQTAVQLTAAVLSAWQAWFEANSPRLALASAKTDLAGIEAALAKQQAQIAALSRQVEELNARISGGAPQAGAKPAAKAEARTPYTGLVIDARGVGFKPCLRPSVYGAERRLLYPGPGVSQARALGRGYVRFYKNLGQAQKSDLVGGLPLTVKPPNTYRNSRNLQLDAKDSQVVTTIIEAPDNFLSQCRVVIVF